MKRWTRSAWLLLALLMACVQPWEHLETTKSISKDGLVFRLPADWVRATLAAQSTLITKDGLSIQQIEVQSRPKDKAFPATRQAAAEGALPYDLANLEVAELRSRPALANLTVLENTPAVVAGAPGFRIRLEWKNSQGAPYRGLVYGALIQGRMVTLTYFAIGLHYFDRDLPAFEQLVASCQPAAS